MKGTPASRFKTRATIFRYFQSACGSLLGTQAFLPNRLCTFAMIATTGVPVNRDEVTKQLTQFGLREFRQLCALAEFLRRRDLTLR
jgi:hypothetical protein